MGSGNQGKLRTEGTLGGPYRSEEGGARIRRDGLEECCPDIKLSMARRVGYGKACIVEVSKNCASQ